MRYFLASAMAMAMAGLISYPASASMELSDKYECTDCHKLDVKPGAARKKKEGPSYKEIAKEYKMGFYEVSAFTGENIEAGFHKLGQMMLQSLNDPANTPNPNLEFMDKNQGNGGCCG